MRVGNQGPQQLPAPSTVVRWALETIRRITNIALNALFPPEQPEEGAPDPQEDDRPLHAAPINPPMPDPILRRAQGDPVHLPPQVMAALLNGRGLPSPPRLAAMLEQEDYDSEEDESILLVAVRNEDPKSLAMLLKSELYLPADIGDGIVIATENGDVQCLSLLLATGVYPYPDLQEAKRIAVENQDHHCLSLLTKTSAPE